MLIIFDGPEKSGKTTIINAVYRALHNNRENCIIEKWGPIFPDDRVYLPYIKAVANSDDFVLWDRGWPSESIYATLLGRPGRRLANDPWLGEWLYGRACAMKVMVLPVIELSKARRDSTDLPVDVRTECTAYGKYANDFQWYKAYNLFTTECLEAIVEDLVRNLMKCKAPKIPYPRVVGPGDAKVLFIGERRPTDVKYPGSWLPFTSPLTMMYGRILGTKAFQFAWTNVEDIPIQEVMKYELVVACGARAYNWVSEIRRPKKLIGLPNPVWLYRYNTADQQETRITVQRTLTSIGETYGYETEDN